MSMRSEPAGANLEMHAPQAMSEKKICVLVVDDNLAMLTAICAMLEAEGSLEIVGTAQDGVDAVRSVAQLKPQLVLMDVNMPLMNGVEAAQLMAKHFPRTKIVLMSGDSSPVSRRRSRTCGAHGFVFKLDLPEKLIEILAGFFPERVAYTTA